MGRKKSKPNDSGDDDNEAYDAILELLDMTGVVDASAHDEARDALLSSLRSMAVATKLWSEDSPETLLRLEECAEQLRAGCQDFMDYLHIEKDEVYLVLREVEEKSKTDEASVWRVLQCHSLVSAYQDQAQLEEETQDDIIAFLSTLYIGEMNAEPKLTEWINLFDRRILMKKTHWKDLLKPLKISNGTCELTETCILREIPSLPQTSTGRLPTRPVSTPKAPVLSSSPIDFVDTFAEAPSPGVTCLLIVGNAGSGKSHTCNQIEQKAKATNVQVIRPTLPLDLMGGSVGQAEDTILSVFGAAMSEKSILILDNMEHILGGDEEDQEAHLIGRLRSTFLGSMDAVKLFSPDLLIVCTSSWKLEQTRFDQTITLSPPNEHERRHMIVSCLGLQGVLELSTTLSVMVEAERLLNEIVECTIGRSRAELAQLSRQTVACTPQEDKLRQLSIMKQTLQLFAPESLRSGVMTDFVDMTVSTARDLLPVSNTIPDLPLFGKGARDAWEQLEALVVTPLCRAKDLDAILFGSSRSEGNVVCGGVLLTGSPGVGKSALARHAATLAAYLLPSFKLLNVSCTSLVHKEVGGSEKSLRRLFECARAAAPCILLMDGIENVAAVRGHDNTTEGTMDRVLSTLLTELDGVDSNFKDGGRIAVIGITHNVSWIDPALRRPGRLERVIRLDLPDLETRRDIAIRELKPSMGELSAKEISETIARQTIAKSGAEVIALCAEGRLNCVREHIQLKLQGQPELKAKHFFNLTNA
jgi:SpoVK/Ycf46/Vps4 family AAA+-type ATPase